MGNMPVKAAIRVALSAMALLALMAAPAFAYDETGQNQPCIVCHSDTADRKGPHGGYTTGTQKCQSCHAVHNAAAGSVQLLVGPTVRATCETCHDGTGGQGVYGVLEARGLIPEGTRPPSSHAIEVTNLVPGGSIDGSGSFGLFSGIDTAQGTMLVLTCTDCHSPHDNDTVEPFTADRLRSENDTNSATKTNRLLRVRPSTAATDVARYGAEWCASCHKGRLHSGAGLAANHPVEEESTTPDPFHYDRVSIVTGMDARATTLGSLGGSNFGYVMPFYKQGDSGSVADPNRSADQAGHRPICQQCHEDGRNVGDFDPAVLDGNGDPADQGKVLTANADGMNEGFRPAADGRDSNLGDPSGFANPRFQTFPHEGVNPRFLIERDDDLCLNCHLQ